MDNREFKIKYQNIKKIIENIDPAGWGARDEYDDIIFQIIKNNGGIKDSSLLKDNIISVLGNSLGLQRETIQDSCRDIAIQILSLYPEGI